MSDPTWHRVADADGVPADSVRMVKAGDQIVALVRTGECLGALNNACPHMGGPLAQGTIEDGRLVCPWHGRAYDPLTGECDGFAERATAYAVDERDDGIYVAVTPAES